MISLFMYRRTKKTLYDWFIPHNGNNHHPKVLHHKHLFIYSYLIVTLKALMILVLFLTFPTIAHFSTITESRIVELANISRRSVGLTGLAVNETLTKAAQFKLDDMFARGYFAHNSPSGVSPWEWFKQAGYTYTYAGENLAMNFVEAENAHQAWMNSESHRANILSSNYDEIGIAVGVGDMDGQQVTLTVQLFGKTFVPYVEGAKSPEIVVPPPVDIPEPSPNVNPDSPRIAQKPINVVSNVVPEVIPNVTPETEVPVLLNGNTNQYQINTGLQQQVALSPSESRGFVSSFLAFLNQFYWAILIFLGISLILKVLIHIKKQHHDVIAHSLFIIIIGLTLLTIQMHFLEAINGGTLVG